MVKKIPDSGLMMGKAGKRRKNLMKQLHGVQPRVQKRKDHGFAKKDKRRALRTLVIPSELMSSGKRKNKKLVVAALIVDHQLKQADEAAAAASRAENKMGDST
jgi:hypothetical protein